MKNTIVCSTGLVLGSDAAVRCYHCNNVSVSCARYCHVVNILHVMWSALLKVN